MVLFRKGFRWNGEERKKQLMCSQCIKGKKGALINSSLQLETAFLIPERANKLHWSLTQPGSCSKSLMSLAGNSCHCSRSTNRRPNKGGKKAPLRWAGTSRLAWSRLRGPASGAEFTAKVEPQPNWTNRDLIVPFIFAVETGPRAKPGLPALDPCLLMVDAATRELS
jgi:hypothetical protein